MLPPSVTAAVTVSIPDLNIENVRAVFAYKGVALNGTFSMQVGAPVHAAVSLAAWQIELNPERCAMPSAVSYPLLQTSHAGDGYRMGGDTVSCAGPKQWWPPVNSRNSRYRTHTYAYDRDDVMSRVRPCCSRSFSAASPS